MHFEMTPEQYRLLSENAKTCGLSKRAYLIRLLQGHHPQARQNDEMKALRREIHAIGNNINQIARSVNAGIAPVGKMSKRQRSYWGVSTNSSTSWRR